MIRTLTTLTAIAAASLLLAAPAGAQNNAAFRMSMAYDGKILVKVFDVRVEQSADADSFTSSVKLTSSGILAAVKKINTQAGSTGRIIGGRARPGTFWNYSASSKSRRRAETTWSGGAVTTKVNPPYFSLGDPPASPAQKAAAADPLTEAMRISLANGPGELCPSTRRMFDGKQIYHVTFSNPRPVAVGKRQAAMGLSNGLRCDVGFTEVAGFKKKDPKKPSSRAVRNIKADFARAGARGPWVMTRMEIDLSVGHGVLELSRLSITGTPPG